MFAELTRASQAALRRTVCGTRPSIGAPPALSSFVRPYSATRPQSADALRSPKGPANGSTDESWGVLNQAYNTTPPPLTPEKQWAARERSVNSLVSPHTTYTGRSVGISPILSLQQAYNKLQKILRANNVRLEVRRSERHEKKGVKRRRLTSERWRRRFAHEVRKKVQIVNEIRARGA